MVVKCIVGLFWATHFQHGGKFVSQNSPTMHFDNHLHRVFRATSKWRITLTTSRKTPLSFGSIPLALMNGVQYLNNFIAD